MARYITSFSLPYMDKNIIYPYNILAPKKLRNIGFDPITIFYGSNGSGKSTLLNLISRKLEISMKDKGNDGRFIQPLIDKCSYIPGEYCEDHRDIPPESRFIRSEEVMHAISKLRERNEQIKNHIQKVRPDLYERFFLKEDGDVGYVWSDDMWIFGAVEGLNSSMSNGELAFNYFQNNIGMNSLTLLDEPENSMSPKYQKELAKMIEDYAHYFKCQFIIGTHSPFLLAIPDVKIYNLDHNPTDVCKVQALECIQYYKELMDNIYKL